MGKQVTKEQLGMCKRAARIAARAYYRRISYDDAMQEAVKQALENPQWFDHTESWTVQRIKDVLYRIFVRDAERHERLEDMFAKDEPSPTTLAARARVRLRKKRPCPA